MGGAAARAGRRPSTQPGWAGRLDKATSELVERGTYMAYGAAESDYRPERWDHFREDYRFTGKEEDVEVGLTYFGKRFYAPLLGRWMSADPLGVHDVGGGADLNLYAYVSGSPLKNIDPLGLEEVVSEYLNEFGDVTTVSASDEVASVDVRADSGTITTLEPTRIEVGQGFGVGSLPGGTQSEAGETIEYDPVATHQWALDNNAYEWGGLAWEAFTLALPVSPGDVEAAQDVYSATVEGDVRTVAIALGVLAAQVAIGNVGRKAVEPTGPSFDKAREAAFEHAGMTDPSKVEFSKVDEVTGTVVEFKGPGGAKVGYDGPHESAGPFHDQQHISAQPTGKRGAGAERANFPYSGPQHPSRSGRKQR